MIRAIHPVRRALLAATLLVAVVSPSFAGWSADPVEVHATSDACADVAAASEAAHGAIIVWRQNVSGGSPTLYARHLLGTGDLDPAWSAPVAIATPAGTVAHLLAVSDGSGGAYVSWTDGTSLMLTRVTSGGTIASGWPAGGKSLGTLAGSHPYLLADATHGVIAAWLAYVPQITLGGVAPNVSRLNVAHLGPSGASVAGWPALPRRFGDLDVPDEFVSEASISLAADGGLWVLWGAYDIEAAMNALHPGRWHLLRTRANGAAQTGWSAQGIDLGTYPGETDPVDQVNFRPVPNRVACAVAADDAGGAWVATSRLSPDYPYGRTASLARIDGEGAMRTGWPRDPGAYLDPSSNQDGGSIVLRAGGPGTVYAGFAASGVEAFVSMIVSRWSDAGSTPVLSTIGRSLQGLETAVTPEGEFFLAHELQAGWYGSFIVGSEYPFVAALAGSGAAYRDLGTSYLEQRYGDVGLTATDDGDAILAWSQVTGRHGIYAVRMSSGGVVTGVPPAANRPPGLSLRFVPGAGVRVRAGRAANGPAVLLLADVAGRVVATAPVTAGEGVAEWTLPGTEVLAPGLYFARLSGGPGAVRAMLVVTR